MVPEVVVLLPEGDVDLAVVDLLAHLQLVVARHGACLRLRPTDVARVRGLLELTGLSVLQGSVEVGGDAEAGEQ